jgi:hypothetical protein
LLALSNPASSPARALIGDTTLQIAAKLPLQVLFACVSAVYAISNISAACETINYILRYRIPGVTGFEPDRVTGQRTLLWPTVEVCV